MNSESAKIHGRPTGTPMWTPTPSQMTGRMFGQVQARNVQRIERIYRDQCRNSVEWV